MTMAGPSGSGKTTLLNMLGGLTRPTRGRIWVRDLEITTLSNKELARLRLESIGFVFQAFNLLPGLSALENAEFSLLLRGVPAEERHRRVRALFNEIGLEGLEDRKPGKLSGGQQQRVAVARAVVGQPTLVLADEPTANLDSETGARVVSLLCKLNEQLDVTFLIATHDQTLLSQLGRVLSIHDGRLREGTT